MTRLRRYVFAFSCVLLLSAFSGLIGAQDDTSFHGCPVAGDATDSSRADPALNRLKNRTEMPTAGFEKINFEDLAELEIPEGVSKKHRDQWPDQTLKAVEAQEKRAVQAVGFLVGVKLEGPESTNCHSAEPAERDFHLWFANSSDDDKSEAVVVEITPRIRSQHASWSRTNLKRLVTQGPRIRISGWIMMDPEHPDQVGKTRKTLWEIHPILKIEVFSGGRWREL